MYGDFTRMTLPHPLPAVKFETVGNEIVAGLVSA
jgi:hypothetical protein